MTREFEDIDIWPCWHQEGWESAAEWSVRDARVVTRAKAHYAATWDYQWTEIGVWKRYLRPLDRQEMWESYCDDCLWLEPDPGGEDGAERKMPEHPPGFWVAPEGVPVWRFVKRDEPGAIPVWIVGETALGPPVKP